MTTGDDKRPAGRISRTLAERLRAAARRRLGTKPYRRLDGVMTRLAVWRVPRCYACQMPFEAFASESKGPGALNKTCPACIERHGLPTRCQRDHLRKMRRARARRPTLSESIFTGRRHHEKLTQGIEFTYSANAADNGIAGELSGQPGVIYNGRAGLYKPVRVVVRQVNVQEGAITVPDDEDTLTLALFVNSAIVSIADEGFAPDESFDVGAAFEFNISRTDLSLTELDVIRVAIVGVAANEETLDWDIGNEGTLEII